MDSRKKGNAERVLRSYGVYAGYHGLRGLLNADAFWDEQPYGTRLYYGGGNTDYLQRGVLRSAVEALDAAPLQEGALPALPVPFTAQVMCGEDTALYTADQMHAHAAAVAAALATASLDDDSDHLKPCPFCGSDAEFDAVASVDGEPNAGGMFVQCLGCQVCSRLIFPCGDDPKPLLLDAWNRRVGPKEGALPNGWNEACTLVLKPGDECDIWCDDEGRRYRVFADAPAAPSIAAASPIDQERRAHDRAQWLEHHRQLIDKGAPADTLYHHFRTAVEAASGHYSNHQPATASPMMVEALRQAEACMSIVEPRSDKAEYLRILGVVRAALAAAQEAA